MDSAIGQITLDQFNQSVQAPKMPEVPMSLFGLEGTSGPQENILKELLRLKQQNNASKILNKIAASESSYSLDG